MKRIDYSNPSSQEDIIKQAHYFLENKATVRQTAEYFRKSKTGIHNNFTRRLEVIDRKLYEEVMTALAENKAVRHLRGGAKTKKMWKDQENVAKDDVIDIKISTPKGGI